MTASLIRLLATLGFLVGAVVGYGIWYRMVADESARSADLGTQIDTKSATQARAESLRATLGQLASDEAVVGKYFVSTANIVSFLGELQSYGTASGASVKVQSVSTATTNGHQVLQVTLLISGSFVSVMNTIGRIEYAPYNVSTIALAVSATTDSSAGEKSGAAKTWSANMNISVGSAPTATSTQTLPTAPTRSP